MSKNFSILSEQDAKLWARALFHAAQRDSFLSRFSNVVAYGTDIPERFHLRQEAPEMSVSHVLNRIREFPLHEIEIVKNEVIAGTNTRVVALYHIGFCPSEEDVWMYTMTVGSVDESLVLSLVEDVTNVTRQVAEGLAEEAVADDALLAELGVEVNGGDVVIRHADSGREVRFTGHNMLEGNEEAMRPEDPGASGAAD